jgi:hypothetical protein
MVAPPLSESEFERLMTLYETISRIAIEIAGETFLL